jgi:hypothetical protein
METTTLMVRVDENGNIIEAQNGKYLMVSPGYTFILSNVDVEVAKLAIHYKIEMDGFKPKLVTKDGTQLPEQPDVPEMGLSTDEKLKRLENENKSIQQALLDLTDFVFQSQSKN